MGVSLNPHANKLNHLLQRPPHHGHDNGPVHPGHITPLLLASDNPINVNGNLVITQS